MLGMGMTLTLDDFKRVIRMPRAAAIGVICQFTIMPCLGFGVARLLGLEKIDPYLAVGLILVSCCPGGTASNVISYLARANVALSVLMTVVSTFAAILLTPLLTKWLVGTLVEVSATKLFLPNFAGRSDACRGRPGPQPFLSEFRSKSEAVFTFGIGDCNCPDRGLHCGIEKRNHPDGRLAIVGSSGHTSRCGVLSWLFRRETFETARGCPANHIHRGRDAKFGDWEPISPRKIFPPPSRRFPVRSVRFITV